MTRRRTSWTRLASFVLLCGFLAGCTNYYKPVSPWERSVYDKSSKDVYPRDVIANPHAHRQTLVAWAGILRHARYQTRADGQAVVRLVVEHRYFDWIEDRSVQKEIFFLSPRGEGTFEAVWPIKAEWDLEKMKQLTVPGDMYVVYGRPRGVIGGAIDLGQADYVRAIQKRWFRDDILDYGRPGEPRRVMKVAL